MFDVPVNEKPVEFVIDRTVVPVEPLVKTIDPVVPKAIALVFVLDELSLSIVRVRLFKFSVPCVSVVANVEFEEVKLLVKS